MCGSCREVHSKTVSLNQKVYPNVFPSPKTFLITEQKKKTRTSTRFQDQKEKPISSGGVATARYGMSRIKRYGTLKSKTKQSKKKTKKKNKNTIRKSTLPISSPQLHPLQNPNPPLPYPTPPPPLDSSPPSSRSTAAVSNSPNSTLQVNGRPRVRRAVRHLILIGINFERSKEVRKGGMIMMRMVVWRWR